MQGPTTVWAPKSYSRGASQGDSVYLNVERMRYLGGGLTQERFAAFEGPG